MPEYGRITSFSLRGRRLGARHAQTMEEFGGFYVPQFPRGEGTATVDPGFRPDFTKIFGRSAPIVAEIGPGSGEQLIHAAQLFPERDFLAFEAWDPGVARCVRAAVRAGVKNVRIVPLDAAQALPVLFAQSGGVCAQGENTAGLCEVWTFFPDPWRKKRHRKRRIVSPRFAHTVARVLPAGGVWRLATDWDNYAWQMRDVIAQSPWFSNPYAGRNGDPADEGLYRGGFAPRFAHRTLTRFESRGREAGRTVHDLTAVRNTLPADAAPVPEDPWSAAEKQGVCAPANRGGERPPSSRRGLREHG